MGVERFFFSTREKGWTLRALQSQAAPFGMGPDDIGDRQSAIEGVFQAKPY